MNILLLGGLLLGGYFALNKARQFSKISFSLEGLPSISYMDLTKTQIKQTVRITNVTNTKIDVRNLFASIKYGSQTIGYISQKIDILIDSRASQTVTLKFDVINQQIFTLIQAAKNGQKIILEIPAVFDIGENLTVNEVLGKIDVSELFKQI